MGKDGGTYVILGGGQSGLEAEVAKFAVNACVRSRIAPVKAERLHFERAEAGGLKSFKLLP